MSTDFTAIATHVGKLLRQKNDLLATAESCTGGWVAQVITAIAGSSDWFDRGFVTYSNLAKQEMLGVSAAILEQHGAVSEATARAMAQGALQRSRATVSLAVTGIAGPTGGSIEKPVGLVWFAWGVTGQVHSQCRQFPGDRKAVREQSVAFVLQELQAYLAVC